jgi:Phage integrase, N-terminal SAM-like domain
MSLPPQIPLAHLTAPPDPARRFRLLEVVRRALRERRYSRRTEEAYVGWIRRYVVFHGRHHPRDLGAEHVRHFLSVLAVEERVAASTQNQALAGKVLAAAALARDYGFTDLDGTALVR